MDSNIENTGVELTESHPSTNSLQSDIEQPSRVLLPTNGSYVATDQNDEIEHPQESWFTSERNYKILKEMIHYHTHFTMLVFFEIMFYFNFIIGYEKSTMLKTIDSIMEQIMKIIGEYDDDQTENLDEICKLGLDDPSKAKNNALYDKALYLIFGLILFLIILLVIETNIFKKRSSIPREFSKALILMAFIALFDYIFFIYFIAEYQIVGGMDVLCSLDND